MSRTQPAGHLSYRPALDLSGQWSSILITITRFGLHAANSFILIGPFRLYLVPLPQFLSSHIIGRERILRRRVCLATVRPACVQHFFLLHFRLVVSFSSFRTNLCVCRKHWNLLNGRSIVPLQKQLFAYLHAPQSILAHGTLKKLQSLLRNSYLSTLSQI